MTTYTERWAAGLADLKTELETAMEKVFEIYIRTTPERLWEAITDPAIRAKSTTARRSIGCGTRFALHVRSPPRRRSSGRGRDLVVEPQRRLVQTMHVLWSDRGRREGTSRVTWEIEPVGDSCRLTVIHDQLSETDLQEI